MTAREAIELLRLHIENLRQRYDVRVAEAVDVITARFLLHSTDHKPPICGHCGGDVTDDYMLCDDLWLKVWPKRRGFLHLICVESLLGRRLVKDDFKAIRMNSAIIYLLDRQS